MTLILRRSMILMLCVASLLACGGGGGGGGGGGDGDEPGEGLDPAVDFFVTGAAIARPIFAPGGALVSGQPLVNPASLQEVDPNTGVTLPGFPKVLNPGTKLSDLATINLAQLTDPLTPQIPLVPRNGALVLEFSKPVDRDSLALDDSDPEAPGMLTTTSPIQVRTKAGVPVPARAFVLGDRVAIVGVTPTTLGFPASPLLFDPLGNVVEDPEGFLRVVLGVGASPLLAEDATPFSKRPDLNGVLRFNPGNAQLDAVLLQTEAGPQGFNGFLPDLTQPRIVREVRLAGTISDIEVVGTPEGNAFQIQDDTLPVLPNVLANGGLGEWAGAVMAVTTGSGDTVELVIETNFNQTGTAVFQLPAGEPVPATVQNGDDYVLRRSEFFEPVPGPLPEDPEELAAITVDPAQAPRDPNDPQDALNSDLRYFVRVFDPAGVERTDQWDPSTGTFLPIDPMSTLQVQFSEAMDPASFRPYETFYVAEGSLPATDPAFREMRLGRVATSVSGNIVRFEPVLVDQEEDSEEFVGFGGTASNLSLVIRTRPDPATVVTLTDTLSAADAAKLEDLDFLGVRGVNDLGGQGLGVPNAVLDDNDEEHFLLSEGSPVESPFPPAFDFRVDFQTQANADPDYRVVVHRFMGQPVTSIFNPPDDGSPQDPVTEGVEYADYPPVDEDGDGDIDRRFIYGPNTLDVGLNAPGRLTGGPASVIEHLIDNFNDPAPGSVTNPLGDDFLISLGFGVSMPINSPFGARMQHVYRATDASPSKNEFLGVVLDLIGLAWAPQGNVVNNTSFDGFGVVVGLSGSGKGFGPNTNQQAGIPQDANSGLARQFDCNWLEYNDGCFGCDAQNAVDSSLQQFVDEQPPHTVMVKRTTPYALLQGNLFTPLSAGGQTANANQYLNYPQFNAGIDPFFGNPNVFSFPYDSRFPMILEYRIRPNVQLPAANLYRFSPGILTSVMPRFRTWSQGQDPLANCIPNWSGATALAGGPPFNGGGAVNLQLFGGEGGPLLEPGTFAVDVQPPSPNNNMPVIEASDYILPPRLKGTCVGGDNFTQLQPAENFVAGQVFNTPADVLPEGCITVLPTCRPDFNTNYYFASGMLAFPLPNLAAYPGPMGTPATFWAGYGVPASNVPPGTFGATDINPEDPNAPCLISFALGQSTSPGAVASNEPGITFAPSSWGDNSRYYMLWKYRKRISRVESPTLEIPLESGGGVVYARPIIEPPLSEVPAAANLKVELRAGPSVDFAVPGFDSGYVDVTAEDFSDAIAGDGTQARNFVKFRATFGVAPQQVFAPTIETIIIPYRKTNP